MKHKRISITFPKGIRVEKGFTIIIYNIAGENDPVHKILINTEFWYKNKLAKPYCSSSPPPPPRWMQFQVAAVMI